MTTRGPRSCSSASTSACQCSRSCGPQAASGSSAKPCRRYHGPFQGTSRNVSRVSPGPYLRTTSASRRLPMPLRTWSARTEICSRCGCPSRTVTAANATGGSSTTQTSAPCSIASSTVAGPGGKTIPAPANIASPDSSIPASTGRSAGPAARTVKSTLPSVRSVLLEDGPAAGARQQPGARPVVLLFSGEFPQVYVGAAARHDLSWRVAWLPGCRTAAGPPPRRRHAAPAERQGDGHHRADAAARGDDRGRGHHLRGGAGRHERGPLGDHDAHARDAEGLSPPLVRHPDHEGGVDRELVGTGCGGGREDHQRDGQVRAQGSED